MRAGCVLTAAEKAALLWTCERLASAEPRVVTGARPEPPALIFTDGAIEGSEREVATCGAMLYDPRDQSTEYFGMRISDGLLKTWQSRKVQAICQVELFPVLVAKVAWREKLSGRSIILYTDNEAARVSLIKGISSAPESACLLAAIADEDYTAQTRTWISRVPSQANPADGPSRLCFDGEWLRGAVELEVSGFESEAEFMPASWLPDELTGGEFPDA
jgi:hypothetical protein